MKQVQLRCIKLSSPYIEQGQRCMGCSQHLAMMSLIMIYNNHSILIDQGTFTPHSNAHLQWQQIVVQSFNRPDNYIQGNDILYFCFLIIQPFCTYLDFIVKLNSLFCLCYYSSIYICCNNSKGSMISSKVFPNIVFKSNQNLAFIGTELIQTHHLQMLPPNHPNIHIYTKAVQKLFSEIPILEQMLWICRIPSTSIIRIFFSEPYKYPCALCCGKPLFIEINPDFSGNFCCSTCNKTIAKFVYSEGGHGSDQALFLQKQRESNSRKNELRCLITSQKFRGKKLKNNFLEKPLTLQTGSFIMEITEPIGQKIVKGSEQIIEGRLEELRDIINDIFA